MGRPPKWVPLLDDPDVRRWHDQLALGSITTAEERIRVLGRFCEEIGMTPRQLADLGKEDNGGRRRAEDLLMDFVARAHRQKLSPGYIENYVKVVKSWLLFNEVALVRKIMIGDRGATPTLADERIPTKQELHGALSVADERGKVIISLCAFSGVRPEVLGNRKGTEGLRVKDLPELDVKDGRVVFRRVPTMIRVRRELSKNRRAYFTFAPMQACRYIASYLERRIARGETLNQDSSIIRVSLRRERQGRPTGAGLHGSEFLATSGLTKEIRKFLWTQVKLRPYVLRSYFDTNLELAERNGKMTLSDRKFFMGRAGDIDRRYTTGKARLPDDVIEAMRKAFEESSSFLVTEELRKGAWTAQSPFGYPVPPAWATPEEYGRAVEELVRIRTEAEEQLKEVRSELERLRRTRE